MDISNLERFAFNQARFVFHAQYTIERDMLKLDVTFEEAFRRIQETDMGQKYLKNVSISEMRDEEKEPGTFMNKNTPFGRFTNDEYGTYVEDFVEL